MTAVIDPARPPAETPSVQAQPAVARGFGAVVRGYVALTKPRIIELLLITTVPAMFMAAHGVPPLFTAFATLIGGTLAAGSANVLNCYIDRDIDQLMKRTSRRPLPQGLISPRSALIFGLVLGAVAAVLLWFTTNPLATALSIGANLYYVLIYTLLLKRRTAQNTFWGGICGAAPVLIGWAAVTGTLSWSAWAFFGIVFFWQMPHFWALAMRFKEDYAAAGVPMLPVVAKPMRVAVEIVVYSWAMVGASVALWAVGMSWIYGLVAIALGGWFLIDAHRLFIQVSRGERIRPMRLFHVSITYLTLLSIAMTVDALV
ncbi:heme o synthase [Fodinicola feengrottensis]|uniref:Protoheme IX farnesyltransferase n=1 Tax=Fodinicola feengrottensis TaxID=435914 RepID=A0ABP4USF1_9ACTN|nr:heme o synthase [Fodinicola feengrottensis]